MVPVRQVTVRLVCGLALETIRSRVMSVLRSRFYVTSQLMSLHFPNRLVVSFTCHRDSRDGLDPPVDPIQVESTQAHPNFFQRGHGFLWGVSRGFVCIETCRYRSPRGRAARCMRIWRSSQCLPLAQKWICLFYGELACGGNELTVLCCRPFAWGSRNFMCLFVQNVQIRVSFEVDVSRCPTFTGLRVCP